ncbi:uncharacterized protein BO97DRAFT_438064 [Aspergillus homomorphus CBS 101889]|uniref:Protein kinase domain-containing protein n=1 Tax=Aspergillus homomorphus (strain CBS 101889) TaxID=1450537 RepID=A0A395HK23_ASPHC|nr:hypothetical protein BO97DRAFT_438064 [Aspergillus homomorphus CBS 101889]RAL07869.1 hypothetical protein BO97DRAFT_438064 [Aspergillus homomorphus CBS 101889]
MSFPVLIGSFSQEQMLGIGRTGLVVRQGQFAVKLPLKSSTSSDEEVEANIKSLQHEQAIYRRLRSCGGVVPFLVYSETVTKLRLIENGDPRSYLSQNKPSKSFQLAWFRLMAHLLSRIDDRQLLWQLEVVMYEVLSLPLELSNGTWPRREDLPSNEGLWLAPVIE